jgi:hypothetical protein
MPLQRSKLLKGFLLVVVGLFVLWIINGGFKVYHLVHVEIPHSYAAWTTGDLIVEYLEIHNEKWPHSWADLQEAKDSLMKRGRAIYWDFNQLPSIVKIDWNVNSETIAKEALTGNESQIFVVTQLDGSKLETRWGPDTDPNRKIAQYFIKKYSTTNSTPKPAVISPK